MKYLRSKICSVGNGYGSAYLLPFRFCIPIVLFVCCAVSCAADNGAVLLKDLKAENYDFFLRADTAAYRQIKKMGRGSAYYVGLHLKRAGHDQAARFYFALGAKLYEAPFNRLCRTALYETGTHSDRLQSVQNRLTELAEPASEQERQEKEALTAIHIRLLLQTQAYQSIPVAPEYIYTSALTAESVQAFPQFGAGMSLFLRTLTEGRIGVFEKRYTEGWQSIQTAFGMEYNLKQLAFPAVLSDIGKAGIYGAEDKTTAALFFKGLSEQVAQQTDGELTAGHKRLVLFYALFYAARCFSRAGSRHLEKAALLFEQAAEQADTDEDFDSAMWYYLDTLRTLSVPRFLQALVQTAEKWKNPAWYADLTENLRSQLTAAQDWKGLETLYTALTKTDLPEQSAAVAYILARSGVFSYKKTQQLLQNINGSHHDSLYYRILAHHQLGEGRLSFYPRKTGRGKNNPSVMPTQEAEPYIDGLLHFGLYALVYPEVAAVYPAIPAEKAEQVAAALEAVGRYADSMRITALALKNQETPETDTQLRRLYPRPWYSIVQKYAAEYRLPEYLLYALIRSESFFQPEIVSNAGAVGLTQLMPATAADIAKKLKVSSYDLTDPETNIKFGAYYLAEMIRRSDNRIMPACFAYNAGISKVRGWQRAAKGLSDDLFLESLEYPETRGYGRKILTAAAVYGSIYYGEKTEYIVRYFFPELFSGGMY